MEIRRGGPDDAPELVRLRQVMFEALMGWFDDQGVDAVDLHATPEGEHLYRSFGFAEGDTVELRRARRPGRLDER